MYVLCAILRHIHKLLLCLKVNYFIYFTSLFFLAKYPLHAKKEKKKWPAIRNKVNKVGFTAKKREIFKVYALKLYLGMYEYVF